jgi:CDP-diglyceride synthetase
MARRTVRRRLVVAVYVVIGTLIVGAWVGAQWLPDWLAPNIFLIQFVVTALLLSHTFYALVKPFNGNKMLTRLGWHPEKQDKRDPIPDHLKSEYLNDELDLHRRNEAHWQAYRWIGPVILLTLAMIAIKPYSAITSKEYWLSRYASSYPYDLLLYCLLTAFFWVYATLPQAILLWTEPDMEEPQ